MLRKLSVCLSLSLVLLAGCDIPRYAPMLSGKAVPHIDLQQTLPKAKAPV